MAQSVLITADTSVVVASVMGWHKHHDVARRACEGRITRLPAHVVLEAVSTLSRLPGGHAVEIAEAVAVVRKAFPESPHALSESGYESLLDSAVREQLAGGQIYDALVGAAAREMGAVLVTLDRRAEQTYRAVGVKYEIP